MSRSAIVLMCAAFAAGWYIQGLRWDKDVSEIKAEAAGQVAAQAGEFVVKQKVAESKAAVLDLEYATRLESERKRNQTLVNAVASGERRLRIEGGCRAKQSTSSGSVGNDASVELSRIAGQNILNIRDGIIKDRTKISYLQNYIRHQCQAEQ